MSFSFLMYVGFAVILRHSPSLWKDIPMVNLLLLHSFEMISQLGLVSELSLQRFDLFFESGFSVVERLEKSPSLHFLLWQQTLHHWVRQNVFRLQFICINASHVISTGYGLHMNTNIAACSLIERVLFVVNVQIIRGLTCNNWSSKCSFSTCSRLGLVLFIWEGDDRWKFPPPPPPPLLGDLGLLLFLCELARAEEQIWLWVVFALFATLPPPAVFVDLAQGGVDLAGCGK